MAKILTEEQHDLLIKKADHILENLSKYSWIEVMAIINIMKHKIAK